jgi:predicted subunit of tRNA(5-methylaminomethyl-2-thiouridylate) methyltransferase
MSVTRSAVKISGLVSVAHGNDAIEEHFDAVMEALMDLDVIDPAITLDLGEGIAAVELVVEESEPERAVVAAMHLVRTALHAAGGSTSDWQRTDDRNCLLTGIATRSYITTCS